MGGEQPVEPPPLVEVISSDDEDGYTRESFNADMIQSINAEYQSVMSKLQNIAGDPENLGSKQLFNLYI